MASIRFAREGDKVFVEVDMYRANGGGDFEDFDVTADVQRLIDEATKELRIERDSLASVVGRAEQYADHAMGEAQKLREENERLNAALIELDSWLHFDDRWGDNEALVPLPHQVEAWRTALRKARKALNRGDRPER